MNLQKILDTPVLPWLAESTAESDVVLSGRVRLARNFAGMPFTHRCNEEQLAMNETKAKQAAKKLSEIGIGEVNYIQLSALNEADAYSLVEKHVISPNLLAEPKHRGILLNESAGCTIMVNEEDHLRIQYMTGGLKLKDTFAWASKIDDTIESQFDYAFSNQLGYLTACPTNVGTGMRVSIMIHVPGLVKTKKIRRIIQGITKMNCSVRGLYGEGTEMQGNVLQISNQVTLGVTEEDIVQGLQNMGEILIKEERQAREALLSQGGNLLKDELWRSYGVLKYAQNLSSQEALNLISQVELGRTLGVLPMIPVDYFRKMMVMTSPGFLQHYLHRGDLSPQDRDYWRATVVRDEMKKIKE